MMLCIKGVVLQEFTNSMLSTLHSQQSQSSGERSVRSAPSSHGHSRAPRRAASSTVIKIVPIGGEVDDASLRSASSMMSMASVGSNHSGRSNRSNVSNRSGVLTRSRSNSSPNTRVEVGSQD